MATTPVDYAAIAAKLGGTSTPAKGKRDYSAIAAQLGGTSVPAPAMQRPQGDLGQQTESLSDRLTRITPDSPRMSPMERGANFVGNIGAGAMGLVLHPVKTAESAFASVMPQPLVDLSRRAYQQQTGQDWAPKEQELANAPNPVQGLYQGLNTAPADTIAPLIGQTAVSAGLGKALPKVGVPLEYVGGKMQEAGTGVINRTVGSLQKDFQRGTNPGQGYFQAGLGPSLSMESIAKKAAAAKAATGEQLGSLYEAATQSGTRIPVRDVSQAVSGPINRARSVITGPGGTGNVAPLEEFGASFRPPLQAGMDAGGMTPSEVFSMKRNVAENTTWNDPTQYNMNKVRQQTTGALGGLLTDTLPETSPLNSQFQNLTALSRRAQLRAQTGSSPLTRLAAKAAYGTGGALLGSMHSPAAAAGTALAGLAADSIPVRTTAASGLYYGGRGMASMGKQLQGLFAPTPETTPVSFAFDRAPARLESNVPGNAGYGEDFSQGNISPQNVYAPPAPATPLQLPAGVQTGPVQPMVAIKAPSPYPPLATDYARTRVVPTRFSGPPVNPFNLPKGYLQAANPPRIVKRK